MKIRIPRSAFLELVAAVAPACGKVGVHVGVHLEADDLGRLVATASDNAYSIQAWAECEVDDPGAIVLPGAQLAKILGVLPDEGTINLSGSGDGGGGRLACGRAEFDLAGYPAAEFPPEPLAPIGEAGRIDLPAKALAAGLRCTVPFVSDEESRPALRNVAIRVHGRDLEVAATDGRRLGWYRTGLEGDVQAGLWLVPDAMAKSIAAALTRCDDDPWIAVQGRKLCAVVGRTAIRAALCDEAFPDYSRVIPSPNREAVVTFDRAKLREALRRVGTMADRSKASEGHVLVKLAIGGREGIALEAEAGHLGKAKDELGLFAPRSSGRVVVGVNAIYLINALDVFTCERVQMQTDDQLSPMLLTADDEPGPGHVVMPMRL